MRGMRRRHQQDGPAGDGQRRQRRQQQADLADALVLNQEFGQRPARPAAAGQIGIEGGKAAGKSSPRDAPRWRWHRGEGIAATDLAAFQRPGKGGIHDVKRL